MWKDFFYFTKGEQRGIVVLIVLITLLFFFNLFQSLFYSVSVVSKEQACLIENVRTINDSIKIDRKDSLFSFDPNSISENEMKLLGFTSYQIKSLIGYRQKVGRFNEIGDLLSVYGFDTISVLRIKDFVKIKDSTIKDANDFLEESVKWVDFNKITHKELVLLGLRKEIVDSIQLIIKTVYVTKSLPSEKVKSFSEKKLLDWIVVNSRNRTDKGAQFKNSSVIKVVELNEATHNDLIMLPGIGNVLAARIIKFRDLLGGFYTKEQLLEVYSLKEETYNSIKDYLFVNERSINKLNLDSVSVKNLSKHPYISYEQSKELYNLYRKSKRLDENDVLNLKSFTKEQWMKIKPYVIMH